MNDGTEEGREKHGNGQQVDCSVAEEGQQKERESWRKSV